MWDVYRLYSVDDDHTDEEKRQLHTNYRAYMKRQEEIEKLIDQQKRLKKEQKRNSKKEKKIAKEKNPLFKL